MPGNPRNPLNLMSPLRGHPAPHRDRALRQPDAAREPGNEAALGAQQVDAVHDSHMNTPDITPQENMNPTHGDAQHHSAMEIGLEILRARKRMGWTQVQLARRLHVDQSAISQWESGKIEPALKHRISLSEMLSVPLDLLLPGAGALPAHALDDPLVPQLIEHFLQLSQSHKIALVTLALGLREGDKPK